jgi:hypothetical protein
MEGWIKLYRKLTENPLWLCEPFTRGQAWVDLILIANHKPDFFYKRGINIDVGRGQVGVSEIGLSDRWKWSRNKVKNFLKDLEKEQQIKIYKTNITQIVTIINYEEYQQKEQQPVQQKSSRRAAEEQQKNTNKNEEKNKNDKNKKERESKPLFDSVPESPDPLKIDFQKLGEYFNKELPFSNITLPMSKGRKSSVQARVKEYGKTMIFDMMKMAKDSPFLAGENEKCWKAEFDWLFNPTNFLKVLEGNYIESEGKKLKAKVETDLQRNLRIERERIRKIADQEQKYKHWSETSISREEYEAKHKQK